MSPGTERTGPRQEAGPDTTTSPADRITQPARPWWDPDGLHWTDVTNWWESPVTAYMAGLVHGRELERQRIAEQDDRLHRQAVRVALAEMDRADRRRLADAGALA